MTKSRKKLRKRENNIDDKFIKEKDIINNKNDDNRKSDNNPSPAKVNENYEKDDDNNINNQVEKKGNKESK